MQKSKRPTCLLVIWFGVVVKWDIEGDALGITRDQGGCQEGQDRRRLGCPMGSTTTFDRSSDAL